MPLAIVKHLFPVSEVLNGLLADLSVFTDSLDCLAYVVTPFFLSLMKTMLICSGDWFIKISILSSHYIGVYLGNTSNRVILQGTRFELA